ncbi:MAG: glucose-6-phosphate dehydrogenase, partial [Frankia sp.]
VAEVAMSVPATLDPEHIGQARETIIRCFRPLSPEDVVLGQYAGYTDIDGVPGDSTTETFVAARLWIDDDRWRGVPFLLRTGKCLAQSKQRVSIIFRTPENSLHANPPRPGTVLSFELSGTGEILLSVVGHMPAPARGLASITTKMSLDEGFHTEILPPYARLLHDILAGDRSAFTRPDGLESVWDTAQPLLDAKPKPKPYARGSWGPQSATALAGDIGWLLGP